MEKKYNIDFVINEILEVIRDNIYVMMNNDNLLTELKSYNILIYEEDICQNYTDTETIQHLLKEVISDMNKVDTIYDFRSIE